LAPIPKRSTSPRAIINTAVVDSLKALDPNRPIRETAIPECYVPLQWATTGPEQVRNRTRAWLAGNSQRLYGDRIGKPLSLPKSCSKNESVPNFSFLATGSPVAAGRHNRKPK